MWGWEARRLRALPLGASPHSVLALSGILLDAILSNFSRVQRLGLPLKMVMYSAVSLWGGRQCHVGTGMRGVVRKSWWSQWNLSLG